MSRREGDGIDVLGSGMGLVDSLNDIDARMDDVRCNLEARSRRAGSAGAGLSFVYEHIS